MEKRTKIEDIDHHFRDNIVIMVGGFISSGCPENIIRYILDRGLKELTLISNTTGFHDRPLGQLVIKKRLKKVVASYIGSNTETAKQMDSGELNVELVPQGTFAERIRCQGAGLGGFLTPTGVGTVVEEGKKKVKVNGKTYLWEQPLQADLALLKAWKADEAGNLIYRYSSRNFNPLMAMAADTVIVEAEKIVPTGSLEANEIMTPGIFVDHIVDF